MRLEAYVCMSCAKIGRLYRHHAVLVVRLGNVRECVK